MISLHLLVIKITSIDTCQWAWSCTQLNLHLCPTSNYYNHSTSLIFSSNTCTPRFTHVCWFIKSNVNSFPSADFSYIVEPIMAEMVTSSKFLVRYCVDEISLNCISHLHFLSLSLIVTTLTFSHDLTHLFVFFFHMMALLTKYIQTWWWLLPSSLSATV